MWHKLKFSDAKTHVVPEFLTHSVLENLLLRGFTLENQETVNSWSIDLGGSVFIDMPQEEMVLDGLKIILWSHQVSGIIDMVKTALPRNNYFKLHHWHHCTVLTQDQRDELVNRLLLIEEDANSKTDRFFEDLKRKRKAN